MTYSEKFSLKWNEFQDNITSAFSNLRDDTTFTDVTLVSEDGHQVEAHKIILSASSPFFMNILKMRKHPNPIIYLKGFRAKELYALTDFMYHGEASVYQDNLDEFLSKASELQLKGLTGEKERMDEHENKVMVQNETKIQKNKELSTYKEVNTKSKPQNEEGTRETYEDKQSFDESTTLITTNSSLAKVSFYGGSAEDLKTTLWSMISQNGQMLTCTICGKSKNKQIDQQANNQMERHVESLHIEGVTYDCTKCDKTFRYEIFLLVI